MPNWCNNSITITGPQAKIKAIWDQANTEDKGLLSAMVPQPEDMFTGSLGEKEREECAAKGIDNWYDWQVANWGTKWDIGLEGLEYEQDGDVGYITGWFDSAWSPPITAYETFCEQNPDCSLDAWYEEGGMDFAGHWSDGVDEHLDNISDYAREVVKTGESGDSLYDELDQHFDITENRRDYIEEELNALDEDSQKVHDLVVERQAQNMENKVDG
jgi:hypothetical protein